MLLLTHIIIALGSLVASGLLLARPTKPLLSTSYSLIIATLASGSLLIALEPVGILHACLAGLVYTTLATGLTLLGKRRLLETTSA